jgi:hypothetical protein
MSKQIYKYIIIDILSGEAVIHKNVRDISEFIKMIYPTNPLSHNTISKYIREQNNFIHEELLIKELVW